VTNLSDQASLDHASCRLESNHDEIDEGSAKQYRSKMIQRASFQTAGTALLRERRGDVVLSGLVVVAFFSRFYLPAESTEHGETLWIAGLWFLVGLVSLLSSWQNGFGVRRRDWQDLSVVLLVGAQVVSGLVVVMTSGDKCSAANMSWEWFCVGIVWFVLRSRMNDASFRAAFFQASIVTGIVLSGLGLWEHFISQPQLAAEFRPLFDQLRTASDADVARTLQKLAVAGVPTDPSGLMLFEKRLLDSREPMGLFGLANTFGGCLVAWLMMSLAALFTKSRRGRWQLAVMPVLSIGVIALCLLLTKSRTAAVGAACGLAVFFAGNRSALRSSRRFVMFFGMGSALLVVVIGLLLRFGGLDRETLFEAPKSLAYRLQYWQATSRLVGDHFLFGVGPGNFRQHYLRYKVAEASEEISDPHNMFFEVAATGGIVSLLGLLMLIGSTVFVSGRCGSRMLEGGKSDSLDSGNRSSRSAFWLAGLAPLLAFTVQLGMSGTWDDRQLLMTGFWFVTAWVWCQCQKGNSTETPYQIHAAFAAFVALAVHLLGAGGIAMPAVSQLLLALIALSRAPAQDSEGQPSSQSPRWLASIAILLTLSASAFVGLTLIPVTKRLWLQEQGNRYLTSFENRSKAELAYRAACLADDWCHEPWLRRAELAFATTLADRFRSNETFEIAVNLLKSAIDRDPYNFQGPRFLGNWWFMRWQVTNSPDDALQAVGGLLRAREGCPTNASVLAELAFAMAAAGQTKDAAAIARQAIFQEMLNRQLGHADRFLTEEIVQRLQRLKNVSAP